jgi:hypothetical protein
MVVTSGRPTCDATGAPRSMKMGTIVSPWRYDGGAYYTLDREKPRPSAI